MLPLETEREFEQLARSPVEETIVGEAGFREQVVELLRTSWLFRFGLAIVAISVFLAAFGPLVAPYDLTAATPVKNQPPSASHWFGTDPSGFDVFSRVLASPRIDVTIALAATALSLVVGSLIGLMTSFIRGWAGEIIMRTSDTVQAIPLFVLAVVFVTMAGRSTLNIIIVVAILNVPIFLRLIRSQVLSLSERTFVEAARANGASGLSIAARHVLPNAMAPGFAQASITMGWAILVTAGLTFIGAGIQPPTPEWGAMVAAGANGIIIGQWWPSVFPGIAMSLTVFGFALVGESLQRVLFRRT
jgi:peptide/nickel transport system permease protein